MKPTLAIYAGHDANISIYDGEKVYRLEFEKVTHQKHFPCYTMPGERLKGRSNKENCRRGFWRALEHLKRDYGFDNDFGIILTKDTNGRVVDAEIGELLNDEFNFDMLGVYNNHDHHKFHSLSAYHQSPFKNAMCFSFDGGGDDYFAAIHGIKNYTVDHTNGMVANLGWLFNRLPGQLFQHTLANDNSIDNAGKVMGLSAYGSYGEDTFKRFEYFFKYRYPLMTMESNDDWKFGQHTINEYAKYFKRRPHITLESEIQIAWELQEIFRISVKRMLDDFVMPRIKDYDNNLVLSGGCAMNVVANQWIRVNYPELNVYVPPDPGDAGLSLGMLVEKYGADLPKIESSQYSGVRLLDADDLGEMLPSLNAVETSIEEMDELLSEGQILGFIYGSVEHGPRALCHRSILADPSIKGMKDTINLKVKNREWYRPFAPVCREVDVETYFESPSYDNLEAMSYALTTREEYREALAAVTHVDHTARVQALTRENSPYIYDLLSMRESKVLLNTSFNLGGYPILNSMKHAKQMLDTTELDAVIVSHEEKLWIIR